MERTLPRGQPVCHHLTCWSALNAADTRGKRSLVEVGSRLLYKLPAPRTEEDADGAEAYDDLELGRQKGSLRDLESITGPWGDKDHTQFESQDRSPLHLAVSPWTVRDKRSRDLWRSPRKLSGTSVIFYFF